MHKTKWMEVQHLVFVCEGCCIRCQHCGQKPVDSVECSSKEERIKEILFNACYRKDLYDKQEIVIQDQEVIYEKGQTS